MHKVVASQSFGFTAIQIVDETKPANQRMSSDISAEIKLFDGDAADVVIVLLTRLVQQGKITEELDKLMTMIVGERA